MVGGVVFPVMVMDALAEQSAVSVIVTVYVPGLLTEMVSDVGPLLHW